MENYCNLCGSILVDNKCPNNHNLDFKKMCLNCKFCDTNLCCINNDVMETMKNNILSGIEKNSINLGNFTIKNIELSPTTIKYPTKRCSKWELNEKIIESFKNSFN